MVDQATRTRAEAIKGFAAVLGDLRASAGNPSFREMSGRSRAISHTTLHEAAQGNRLPSWATTVEFVKACGADPAAYRERWEQANEAVRGPAHNADLGLIEPAPASDTAPPEARPDDAATAGLPHRRWRRLRFVVPGVLVAGAAVTTAILLTGSSGPHTPGPKQSITGQQVKAQLTPADCPVHTTNPPYHAPEHYGDASAFIADITLPDCSHIRRGQIVTKIWRLRNTGKVTWQGYTLHRLGQPQQRNQCQTISDVPVPVTAPGRQVDIRVQVTAPQTPGFCFARFKMMDAAGHVVFPGSRPVNFQVIVD